MQHLFQSWREFSDACRNASNVLMFFDYDGTLTPIVSRPELAVLSEEVRDLLRALAQKPALSAGIISGRSLAEIKSMVAVDGLYYAGNHGLEIEGPGLKYVSREAETARALIKDLAGKLAAALDDISGIIIEDKGLSLSVHYRLVGEGGEKAVGDIFQSITGKLRDEGKIRITTGKKVFEVRPPIDWNKGKAVEKIAAAIKSALNTGQALTVYLGDDNTDEDAFKILHHPEGWSIYVGGENASSTAEYYLDSPSEVTEFLSRVVDL
ncbi:MAG TPA: trehalose-phosphatase [Dehalococcoidia bacterium]|nr:trehalose-phosphatase [Dehalococcoidia bacterium]